MSMYETQETNMREQDKAAQNSIARAYGLTPPYDSKELTRVNESKRAAALREVREKAEQASNRDLEILKARAEEKQAKIDALCSELSSLSGLDDRAWGIQIARAVAKAHGLTWTEFTSKRRWKHLTKARQHAMWEIYRVTGLSLPSISRILGGFDHTTILYGIRAHQKRLDAGGTGA